MSEENEEETGKTTLEVAGIKFTGGKMFAVITALTTLVGGLYGAFEVYKDYMDMKEQIQSYVAPDLSGFQEQLSVMEEKLKATEDSVLEARDYTRDIKTDLKTDIDRLESVVDQNETRTKKSEDSVREMIDLANQRFDTKRESLSTETDRKITDLEGRLNTKIQTALDNPLAN